MTKLLSAALALTALALLPFVGTAHAAPVLPQAPLTNPCYLVPGAGANGAPGCQPVDATTHPVPVAIISGGGGGTNPATIYSGQQTITASAVALPTKALTNGLIITAPTANTGTVYVGPSGVTTGTGYKLAPGTSISYGVTNANAIFVIGTASDTISFTGN